MAFYKHIVQYYETDKMGITHHSNYIRFMEEARINFLKEIGWSYEKMEAEGVVSPVVRIVCDYKKSTTFADEIFIKAKVLDISRVKLTIGYTMTVGDCIVCTGESEHCFLSDTGRPVSIQRQYPDYYAALIDSMEK